MAEPLDTISQEEPSSSPSSSPSPTSLLVTALRDLKAAEDDARWAREVFLDCAPLREKHAKRYEHAMACLEKQQKSILHAEFFSSGEAMHEALATAERNLGPESSCKHFKSPLFTLYTVDYYIHDNTTGRRLVVQIPTPWVEDAETKLGSTVAALL